MAGGGNILNRVFELKGELPDPFSKIFPDFAECFEDEGWLQKLASLADIVKPISPLSTSLEGPKENAWA